MTDTTTGPATDPTAPAGGRVRRLLPAATGVVVIAVGAAALIGSRDYQYWTALGPGPGFFPRWLGGLLVVLGALWLVQILRAARVAPAVDEQAEPIPSEEQPPEYAPWSVVAIVASLCVLAGVLETVGFQVSMLVFLLFHLLVLGRRRLLVSVVIALAGSFGVFVVFTRLLTVPLPASSLPFLRDMGL